MFFCGSVRVERRFLVLGAVWRSITYTNRGFAYKLCGAPDSTQHGPAHGHCTGHSFALTATAQHTQRTTVKHTATAQHTQGKTAKHTATAQHTQRTTVKHTAMAQHTHGMAAKHTATAQYTQRATIKHTAMAQPWRSTLKA
jgi:uncharacterized protein (DUF2252 family)